MSHSSRKLNLFKSLTFSLLSSRLRPDHFQLVVGQQFEILLVCGLYVD